ncbi:MAG: DUF1015 domain-containing protein [Actinobacteria bacterium]|nr:DUF1015 domain-containing protein [Actinomycetota bacterium]
MADVRPFRAVRYARPGAELTAPPYDVIDAGAAEELRARDPHNVVHLTLEPDERRAGARYREWLEGGILVRDDEPAVWALEQEYVGPDGIERQRRGLVASLRVEPYATGTVLPHERTHAGPKASRLRLLESARAQLEPIFLLYDGSPMTPPRGEPELDVAGTRLWPVGDLDVASAFAGSQLLIADGHHRYETALEFAARDGADRMMVVLVSMSDPGLEIFATHRVFAGRDDIDLAGEPFPTVEDAFAALADESYARSAAVLVRPGSTRLVHGVPGELDVELVDRLGHDGISYTPDRVEAVRRVESGFADCALLLRPTRIEDIFAHARQGEVMPQKTTYFFPKLLSGLLFHPIDP